MYLTISQSMQLSPKEYHAKHDWKCDVIHYNILANYALIKVRPHLPPSGHRRGHAWAGI